MKAAEFMMVVLRFFDIVQLIHWILQKITAH
jgi:hypothetical protein